MPSPTSWKTYNSKVKAQGISRSDALSRFVARYSLASEIESLTLSDTTKETSAAYTVLLRVMLAYSALELLEKALGAKNQIGIFDESVSDWFRHSANSAILDELVKSVDKQEHRKQRENLTLFQTGNTNDLRPLAFAIRNLMAHGTLSASRLNLAKSKRPREIINQLADATLAATDERFTKYVRRTWGNK